MKIAVFTSVFPRRSETFVVSEITGLLDRGHDVHIYARFRGDDFDVHPDLKRYQLQERIVYFEEGRWCIPENRLKRIGGATKALLQRGPERALPLVRLLNLPRFRRQAATLGPLYWGASLSSIERYDLIHCHFGYVAQAIAMLRAVGIVSGRHVTTFHGHDLTKVVTLYGERFFDFLFAHGDLFLPVSHCLRDQLLRIGCPPERTHVHRLGVDLARFGAESAASRPSRRVRVLTVARLVEFKGIEYGIRAVARAARATPEIEYLIAGEGPLWGALSSLIRELGLETRVRLLGPKRHDEIPALLDAADLLLAPSVTPRDGTQEGVPIALMEAMAHGLPVVASDHAGIGELVQDGKSGFLAGERDVGALADAVEQLAKSPALREQMGGFGRRWVQERHDIEKQNDRLVGHFDRLLRLGPADPHHLESTASCHEQR